MRRVKLLAQHLPSRRARSGRHWLQQRLVPSVLLLATTYCFGLCLVASLFAVTQIHVTSQTSGEVLRQEDITRAIAGAQGTNIFTLQTDAVRSRVAALPEVREATVTPRLPNGLDVGVLLYVPSMVWHSGGLDYLVTDMGFVIDRGARQDLMRLDDDRPMMLAHGDHVNVKTVQGAQTLQRLLKSRQVVVQRYVTLPDDTIRVEGSDNWSVLFSLRGDLVREADTLAQVEQQHISFQVLDLRYGSSAFFR